MAIGKMKTKTPAKKEWRALVSSSSQVEEFVEHLRLSELALAESHHHLAIAASNL